MGTQVICPCCGHGCPAVADRCASCDAVLVPAVPPAPHRAVEDPFAALAVPGQASAPARRRGPALDRPRWKGPASGARGVHAPARSAAPLLGGVLLVCVALVAVAIWAARRMISAEAPPAAPVVASAQVEQAPSPAPPPLVARSSGASVPFAGASAGPGPALRTAVERPAAVQRHAARAERGHRGPPAAPPLQDARDEAPAVVGIGAATVDAPTRAAPPGADAAPAPAAPASRSVAPAVAVASGAPPERSTVEDAPRFATEGFRRPRLVEPRCVQEAVRVPRGIAERLSGPVTIKFAVAADGTVGLFEVVGDVPDRRVADALWTAVRSCRFVAGADAAGRPTRLWVVMPIRFGG
ncbi:energy transducer TonB [Anaeromyxobacter oryzae]|uniref:TonB C-terminal domain-containing protein n=1 Tax=Anaeromyxobacter oryzae TaxID=2918170 RepID=A0ABM7WQ40_9BACT|nr:energy transducer TonB [Anaeromyxobacter oryzae]BDG01583.1 hypothetical protein AMOR_05790 [Anaeromyxobacter oryzae]